MLNTSNLIKKNNYANSIINTTINKIEEKIGGDGTEVSNNDIIKSFHSMETKIFSNVQNKLENEIKNDNNNDTDNDNINAIKIDGFKFDEITKKYSDTEFTKNILDNNKKFLISIHKKHNKFSIFDENNRPIGHFTVFHIVKYLADIYDTKQQFLKEIESTQLQKSKELIKKLIFKLKYNNKNKYTDIILLDYSTSGFMGDIDLLIKLNNQLHKYQTKQLYADLSNVDIENKIKIEQNIKKFIFILLNYTLQLISIVSSKDNNKELKEKLVNYSIGIVYRINIFVQEQLKIINNQNKNIKESIDMNIELKKDLNDKLNILIEKSQKSYNKNNEKHNTSQFSGIELTDSQIKKIIYENNL